MKIDKNQLFKSAIELNGDDKKYQIIIEDDKIITRVKWMDATFFSTDSITDEMRKFEYVVKVNDNGTYTELDKSVSSVKSANSGGLKFEKNYFVGKQITYEKTIGIGRNKENGELGLVQFTFNSEEYKKTIRTLLKNCGYKKKMGFLGKICIGTLIFSIIVVILFVLLFGLINNKEPISVSDFETISSSFGYQVAVDEQAEKNNDFVQAISIAVDTEDDYQVDLYVLSDSNFAKNIFSVIKTEMEKISLTEGTESSSTVDFPNFNKYSATTESSYLYISRIDDTVLCIDVDVEHKDEVEKFIEKINY